MAPAASPTRRVLGEKDANASLNITSPRKSLKTNLNSRKMMSPQIQSKALSGAIDAVVQSPRIGQKRRITEVEGVETRDWDERARRSQTMDIVSDSASEADQIDTSMISSRSAANTAMTSFGIGASQENRFEQQFELMEPEMSQRTLEKIHAVPLPQNTSQPSQLRDRPNLIQQASQESVGMSNFVNFHSDPSSQASDGMRMIDPSMVQGKRQEDEQELNQSVENELSEEEKRKAMMEEKAKQLRLRLQLALFKVETRQTNTPFSRLKVPESHRRKSHSSPLLPPLSSVSHRSQSHSISALPQDRSGFSPEARIAALRAQATMQNKPTVRSLNSLPMPQIKPTAFSARWADQETTTSTHGHPTPRQHVPSSDGNNDLVVREIPSSPPISSHSLHIHEDDTATAARSRSQSCIRSSVEPEVPRSPALPTPKTPTVTANTNPRLSSLTPGRDVDEECIEETDEAESGSLDITRSKERRLTSSIVKGEAASGLLELMRSGRVNSGNIRGPMCGI